MQFLGSSGSRHARRFLRCVPEVTWIREFMRANPKIQLDFVLGDAAIDLIAQGIDMAFQSGCTTGETRAT